MSVIVAVFGIMVFLAEVVAPLLMDGALDGRSSAPWPRSEGRAALIATDENLSMIATVSDSGQVSAVHAASGERLVVPSFEFDGRQATAAAHTLTGNQMAFGFEDGSIRFANVEFKIELIESEARPAGLKPLGDSGDLTDGSSVFTPIATGQLRKVSVVAAVGGPQMIASRQPIRAIDYRVGGPAERPVRAFVTVDAAGVGRLSRAETRKNMVTGRERISVTTAELPGLDAGVAVSAALINDQADQVYFAETSGTVRRYDARDFSNPVLAETIDIAPGATKLTSIAFLIGEQSLVVGRDDGSVDIYFRVARDNAATTDGYVLIPAKSLERHPVGVVRIAPAQRGKMFATADAEGDVWVRHGTSAQLLLKLAPEPGAAAPASLVFAPRDNALISQNGTQFTLWRFDLPHPETTIGTIFGRTWYEGYAEPTFTWQSSAGSDAFEPKLSLIPLIFGTLKATFYSLLFAVPIALGAAIFTAEFTGPRVRAVVKPTMELMASLPSVVLGFIAAIILAPIAESAISAVLIAFGAIPAGLIFAACLWQLVPRATQARFGGLVRLALATAVVLLTVSACAVLAPTLENIFFAGDFKAWVSGATGTSKALLALMLWPAVFAGFWLLTNAVVGAWVMRAMKTPSTAGRDYLARWVVTALAAAVIAVLAAQIVVDLGGDVRGGVLDTFVQRNSLIVGFAMGFAVIPIIYTVSEDALTAVPEHLRAASLGLGATQWQTTIRVVVPAAMSGIFAAVMVGMGRAVGETMIVVMAAGNTPIIDWNLFAGLRALSANIAVEMPEAVRDSTLYRMLFLAALTLFAMTFVVNTLAEVVRLRFRKQTAAM
ncbi:MAG: ABC transporter permease subunit [Alphaproteobacteria bacterium]|nr:ABC transporter permease subunit [Alphaproteobacteria bacterium]